MSAIVKDELVKPMDKAVWNVEHILKFANSRHLQYHGRNILWISYYATFVYLVLWIILLSYITYKSVTFIKNKLIKNIKRKLE